MPNNVEERVAVLKFDNKDFESHVKQSSKSLEAFQKLLRFDKVGDGISKVGKAVAGFSMDHIDKQIHKITSSIGVLEMSILRIKDRAAQAVSGTVIEMGKMVTGVQGAIDGFREYETQIGAVQTILSNTRSKGTTIDDVNAALDELNEYADLTIYNFTEMTRNIGTFTAAGVDLQTSTQAIKGISNLAAISGSNAQQASTAMYQLSQALSSGTVKLQDWNSVVNASMGGQVFQDSLMETARVHGIAIDDMLAKEGSFRETLQKGWLTSEILLETLGKFAGDYTDEQLRSMGYTEEQITQILELGKDATDAATKVKTFTQLMDTLREAAGSGWTQSFEILVGDFEEAKEMFTEISDAVSWLIGETATKRNNYLEAVFGTERAQTVTLEMWQQFAESGLASDDFKAQIVENARAAGKSVDELIAQYGSFEASLAGGWLDGTLLQNTLDWTANLSETSFKWAQGLVWEVSQGVYGDEEQTREALEAMGKDYELYRDLANKFLDPETYGELNWDEIAQDQDMLAALGVEQTTEAYQDLAAAYKDADSALSDLTDSAFTSGRERLLDGLGTIGYQLIDFYHLISWAFEAAFPAPAADALFNMIDGFALLMENAKLTGDESEKVYDFFKGLFDLFGIAVDIIGAVADGFGQLFSAGMDATNNRPFEFILDFLQGLGKGASDLRAFIKSENKLKTVTNVVAGTFGHLWDVLSGVWNFITSIFSGGPIDTSFIDAIGSWITDLGNGISGTKLTPLSDMLTNLKELFAAHGVNLDWMDDIINFFNENTLGDIASSFWTSLFGDENDIVGGLGDWVGDVQTWISNFDPIKAIGEGLDWAHGMANGGFDELLANIFPEDMTPLETVQYWIDTIVGWASGIEIPEVFKNIGQTIVDALSDFVTWVDETVFPDFSVVDTVTNGLDTVVDWVTDNLDIEVSGLTTLEGWFNTAKTTFDTISGDIKEMLGLQRDASLLSMLVDTLKGIFTGVMNFFHPDSGQSEGGIDALTGGESEEQAVEADKGIPIIEKLFGLLTYIRDKITELGDTEEIRAGFEAAWNFISEDLPAILLTGGIFEFGRGVKKIGDALDDIGDELKLWSVKFALVAAGLLFISMAIAILGFVVGQLGKMDPGQVIQGTAVVWALGILLGGLAIFVNKSAKLTDGNGVISNLATGAGLLLISFAIGNLAIIVSKLGKMDPGQVIQGTAVVWALGILLGGLAALVNKLNGTPSIQSGGKLGLFSKGVDYAGLFAVAEGLGDLMDSLQPFIGYQFEDVSGGLELLALALAGLVAVELVANMANFTPAGSAMAGALGLLAGGMGEFMRGAGDFIRELGNLYKTLEGTDAATDSIQQLETQLIDGFIDSFTNGENVKKMTDAFFTGFMEAIADIYNLMADAINKLLENTPLDIRLPKAKVTVGENGISVDRVVEVEGMDDLIYEYPETATVQVRGNYVYQLVEEGNADNLWQETWRTLDYTTGERNTLHVNAGDLGSDLVDVTLDGEAAQQVLAALEHEGIDISLAGAEIQARLYGDKRDVSVNLGNGGRTADALAGAVAEETEAAVEEAVDENPPQPVVEAESQVEVVGAYVKDKEAAKAVLAADTQAAVSELRGEEPVDVEEPLVVNFSQVVMADGTDENGNQLYAIAQALDNGEVKVTRKVAIDPEFEFPEGSVIMEDVDGSLVDQIAMAANGGNFGQAANLIGQELSKAAESVNFDETGRNVIYAFSNSLNDTGPVKDASTNLGKAAIEPAEDVLETHSPSRRATEDGLMVDQGLVDGLNGGLAQVSGAARSVSSTVVNQLKTMATGMYNLGLEITNGLTNGINAGASRAITAAVEMATRTYEASKKALEVGSPSRKFFELGWFSGVGDANGMLASIGIVEDAAGKLGGASIDAMRESISEINNAMGDDYELGPTIRPVMDLSDFQAQNSKFKKSLSSYGDQVYGRLSGIDENLSNRGVTQVFIDGAIVNDTPEIQNSVRNMLTYYKRLGLMQ